MTKLADLKAKIAKLNAEVKEASVNALNEGFEDIFNAFPTLTSFSWNQYTPYWNDGDECTFRVNEYSVFPRFTDEPADSEEDYQDAGEFNEDGASPEHNKAFKQIRELIGAIDEDTMKSVYDNHVTVVISKNEDGKIVSSTEEFEHD